MDHPDVRLMRDSLGEVTVPADALYGPRTQRAITHFTFSGFRFPRAFGRAGFEQKGCRPSELRLGTTRPQHGGSYRGVGSGGRERAWNLLSSVQLLTEAARSRGTKAISGFSVNVS